MSTQTRKTVCFAYFADGKFIGWYADSFGSIRPESPKVYGYTDQQVGVITDNFRNKMSKLKEPSTLVNAHRAMALVDSSINKDASELAQYEHVELRVVECPEYDGPNPDFDHDAYKKAVDARHDAMTAAGIFDIPAPSMERTDAVAAFNANYGRVKCDNWIYCDYVKVKEWAKKEPIEFLSVITVE